MIIMLRECSFIRRHRQDLMKLFGEDIVELVDSDSEEDPIED